MRRYVRYSDEQIKEAIANSKSWREVANWLSPDRLGHRSSESHLKQRAVKIGVDFSHFIGNKKWHLGRVFGPKRPIEDYFNGLAIKSNALKHLLFKKNLKDKKCELCQNTHWQGEEIPLHMHHIDENPKNNQLENLKILCPNCHSFTHESVRKIRRDKSPKVIRRFRNKSCKICKAPAFDVYCSQKCFKFSRRKVVRPTKAELEKLIKLISFTKISRKFNVTDNTIRQWCQAYLINWKELSPYVKEKVKS